MRESSMKKSHEAVVLDEICRIVREEGKISQLHVFRLSEAFGQRSKKALETIKEGRVKKYIFQPSGRVVWIVVGKNRDYIVMPQINYCSCYDFYFQFDQGHLCYHIIAQKLAEADRTFDEFEDEDQLFDVLIEEWKAPDHRKTEKSEANKDEKD